MRMQLCAASMTSLLVVVVVVTVASALADATGRSSDLGGLGCKLDNTECVKSYLQDEVIAKFSEGFPEYGVKSFDPLYYEDLTLNYESGPGINITVNHIKPILYGLRKTKVLDVRSKLTRSAYSVEVRLSTPKLHYQGSYKTSGEFLMFPINWSGHYDISMGDVSDTWKMNATLIQRGDDHYLELETVSFSPEMKTCKVLASGLFWGNEDIGNFAVKMVNERWEKFFGIMWKAVEPQVVKSAAEAVSSVFKNTPVTGLIL